MSCELRVLSLVNDLEKCRLYLFQGENDPLWLQKCVVAVSPLGDRLLIAHGTAMVSLIAQWDRSENTARFVISKQWELTQDSSSSISDTITSAIILPIVAVGNQAQGVADWYCTVIGLASGSLRFMTENLISLADVRLHSERVLQIKATRPRGREEKRSGTDAPEFLSVVYPSVICNIPGFSLFQTLRGCRSEVALKRARDDKTSSKISVEHKKYGFSESPVRDACVVNSRHCNNFDHLLSVTIADGFYKNYRPSPPHQTVFASTGSAAWLHLDHSIEGVAAPLELTDVAFTVISKLPGWLGLSSGKSTEPAPKITEKLRPRCKLLDRRREGKSVICSPDGSLLVVVDMLGRVTLVEARTGVAIRLWKGYRDAECGFLEVEEEIPKTRHKHRHDSSKPKTEPRVVLLLVIYVPKKGLIELFPLRHGPRVAALRVSKTGRLLYVPHGLMGHTTPAPVPRKGSAVAAHLVFLSMDGLMDLMVPFHCAFMDVSVRAKDLHVLKQLKTCLKEGGHDDVASLVKQLETDEVKLSAIDLISSNHSITPDVLNAATEVILETAHDKDIPQKSGTPRNALLLCKQLRKVVRFYCAMENLLREENADSGAAGADEIPMKELLQLSDSEIQVLQDFSSTASAAYQKKENRVTFHVSSKGSLSRFIQSLDLSEAGSIMQASKLSHEDHRVLGEFVFAKIVANLRQLEVWKNEAQMSSISASVFARSFVTFWLNRPVFALEGDVRTFIEVMRAICPLSDEPVTSPDYNVESAWWTELRGVIAQSTNTLSAMIVAVCCRAVSLICEQEGELEKCDNPKDSTPNREWETISADTWQWDSLISRLEDVHLLNTVLRTKPDLKAIEEPSEVSLAELISAGDSAVSELVAKWLIMFNVEPRLLVDENDAEFKDEPETSVDPARRNLLKGEDDLVFPVVEVGPTEPIHGNVILDKFKLLKKRFPYSLTSSGILSHIGWELMNRWQQDLLDIDLLNLAIDHFINIPSAHLKSAVCSLAWSAYVKVHFEGITRLVSKMGKLPTDTLCVREIGMPRGSIAEVMKSAKRLLTAILDACAERPQVRFLPQRDALWGTSQQPASLISVAVSKSYPCEDVVLLHHQITTTVHMVAALEIRDKAVLSALFDSLKHELFGELTTRRSIALHHPGLSDVLSAFLRRAVSAAVQTIHEVETANGEVAVDSVEACHWLRVCMELGSTWRLPLDALRRHHVCELYAAGYDRLAEEALPGVQDTPLLASQLLVVVGHRINSVISTSSAPQQVIAELSPSLTTWLKSLDDGESRTRKASIEDTEILMGYILHNLPERHIDSHIATIMAECLTEEVGQCAVRPCCFTTLISIAMTTLPLARIQTELRIARKIGALFAMDPLYLALSMFRKRQFEECVEITTEILERSPYDETAWALKMKALTAQVYVDDLEEEEGLADTALDSEVIASIPRPGTSLKLPTRGPRPVTGVVRPNSSRPGTMEQALKTPRTAKTARPVTAIGGRRVRLGTASMLTEPDGPFIEVSRLNMQKYARAKTAKLLFEYLYYHQHDVERALELCVEATRVCEFRDWWWKLQLGKCYFALGLVRDAEAQYRSALKQHVHVELCLRLSRVLIRLDQPLLAIDVLDRGLQVFQDEATMLTHIGRLHEGLNDMALSNKFYRKVIHQAATNVEAIACVAVYHFYADQPEIALNLFRRLLQMGILNAAILNNIGLSCFYAQQYSIALAVFRKAILVAEGEDLANVWFNLSHISMSVGDVKLASECLKLCISYDGNNAQAFNNLGVLEMRRGQIAQARAFFLTAARLAPELFEPNFNHSLLAYECGDLQTSYIVVQKALDCHPDHVNAQTLLKQLRKHFTSI